MDIPPFLYNIYIMGMFDTVVIDKLKLPNLPKEVTSYLKNNNASIPTEYQTKDLENCLLTYTIDSSGQIYLTEFKPTGKKIPYESPFKNWTDSRSFLERVYFKIIERRLDNKYPTLRKVEERKPVKVKTKLTNTFNVYSYDEIGGRYVELEFGIVAVDGKVKKVNILKSEIESEKLAKQRISEREKFEKNLSESIASRNKFRSKWYYPLIKETYNPFVFFTSKLVQKLCNKILSLSYRWTGV